MVRIKQNQNVTKKKTMEAKPSVGRKRNPALDAAILEAAIQTLSEVGFDSMTMDQVAALVGSAKTTIYRRWPSKVELVRDALIWMSRKSVEVEKIPDTGHLRTDLLSVQKDYSPEHSERKLQVLSKLGSFQSEHQKAAEEVAAGVFGPMNKLNAKLIRRAVERGEISRTADVEMACLTIAAVIAYYTGVLHKPFDKTHYAKLLDTVILPALTAGSDQPRLHQD